ncbi:MAG: DUF4422 domain-containing protein [Selenomonadaceae bacterium]|nr:DUF4422 domain-containing protein [Selenomonadaceae bacterium]
MAIYIPRVLICGDIGDFRKNFGDKPAEIVGQVILSKTDDDVKLFLGERALTNEDIIQMLDGMAEYLIFVDDLDFYYYLGKFSPNSQVMTAKTFAKKIHDMFFTQEQFFLLEGLLDYKNFKHVLDLDCFLAKSDFHTKTTDFNIAVDCISDNLYPIMENVYGKIYRLFDECKFHRFDAVILSKERIPAEFIDALIKTDSLTEKIFAFVRKNSLIERWLAANQNIFAQIECFKTSNGSWWLLKKNISPDDVGIYIVTHKNAKLYTLPEGYKIIHAGRALNHDLGYIGDDTGENISRLNPFLDEITALYWIWKNTFHTHIGICHYRRFFTTDRDKKTFKTEEILSAADILKILTEYDIIVKNESITGRSQRDVIIFSTGQPDLVKMVEKIIRKHLSEKQPDYLDIFDDIMSGITMFPGGIHVTRRNIFNAYCEWLFSFIIDATKEIQDKIRIGNKNLEEMGHDYSRTIGYFAERMLTIWLVKNHLRIKEMPIMYREGI